MRKLSKSLTERPAQSRPSANGRLYLRPLGKEKNIPEELSLAGGGEGRQKAEAEYSKVVLIRILITRAGIWRPLRVC